MTLDRGGPPEEDIARQSILHGARPCTHTRAPTARASATTQCVVTESKRVRRRRVGRTRSPNSSFPFFPAPPTTMSTMSEAVSTPHFATPPFATLVATLGDVSQPVAARMRSIFYLRTLGGPDAIGALCAALRDVSGTVLFRHEIAYVLGQMQAAESLPTLLAVLRDTADEPIVRHEVRDGILLAKFAARSQLTPSFTPPTISHRAFCANLRRRRRSVRLRTPRRCPT